MIELLSILFPSVLIMILMLALVIHSFKGNPYVISFLTLLSLSTITYTSFIIYDSLGKPKSVHLFNADYIYLFHTVDSNARTVYIFAKKKGEKSPVLLSVPFTDNKKFEDYKKGFEKTVTGKKPGEMLMLKRSDGDEVPSLHRFSLNEEFKKG